MSIRIQNDGIASAATSQTAPADNIGKPGSSGQAGRAASASTDQVDISSLSGNIAAASSALAAQHADRVDQLTAIYSRGAYQADSAQLSRALVANAIGGGSLEADS